MNEQAQPQKPLTIADLQQSITNTIAQAEQQAEQAQDAVLMNRGGLNLLNFLAFNGYELIWTPPQPAPQNGATAEKKPATVPAIAQAAQAGA